MIILYADDHVVEEIPEESDFAEPIWVNPRCKGCGALLIRDKPCCEYCGRERDLRTEVIA